MADILKTVNLLHSAINFKIHTLADISKCEALMVSQVILSKDLGSSDRFFDSIEYR